MGVDFVTFLQKHPEHLPDKYKFMRFDEINPVVLNAIFQALSPQAQGAYRAQLVSAHIDDRPPDAGVMEGGKPRNS